MIKTFLLATLESTLNHFITLDPQTFAGLKSYAGKVIRIRITTLDLELTFMLTEQGIQMLDQYMGSVDTTISGTLIALMQQLKASPAANQKVSIIGDIELSQRLRTLLRSFDIDWEEQLSRITGDMIAHQAGNTVRKFFQWGRQSLTNFQQDLTAYLQEEAHYLPSRYEIDHFITEVNDLRHAAARLEARLNEN